MRDLFDPVRGEAAKREGMGYAADGADDDWWVFMAWAVRYVAERQEHFASDDVERVRIERGGPETHEKRAFGPVMMRARRDGICVPTNRFDRSSLIVAHRRPMMIWRSLIYQGPKP